MKGNRRGIRLVHHQKEDLCEEQSGFGHMCKSSKYRRQERNLPVDGNR